MQAQMMSAISVSNNFVPYGVSIPLLQDSNFAGGTELEFEQFASSTCLFPAHTGFSYLHLQCHSAP